MSGISYAALAMQAAKVESKFDPAAAAHIANLLVTRARPRRILVVDDDPDIGTLLCEWFRRMPKMEAFWVSGLDEAHVQLAVGPPIGLAVIDIHLLNGDHGEVLANELPREIAVIMISGAIEVSNLKLLAERFQCWRCSKAEIHRLTDMVQSIYDHPGMSGQHRINLPSP